MTQQLTDNEINHDAPNKPNEPGEDYAVVWCQEFDPRLPTIDASKATCYLCLDHGCPYCEAKG